ncbi:MAG TPA: hypothetical protein P5096_00685 [Patescibacteria group bacterium]|nr:hypothetical protein [Patescibacteria group bacterium]
MLGKKKYCTSPTKHKTTAESIKGLKHLIISALVFITEHTTKNNSAASKKYALKIPKEILLSGEINTDVAPPIKNISQEIKKGFLIKSFIDFLIFLFFKALIRKQNASKYISSSKIVVGTLKILNLIK